MLKLVLQTLLDIFLKDYLMLKALWVSFFQKLKALLQIIFYAGIVLTVAFIALKVLFGIQLPSLSWWSATILSDNYAKSIITEVESSGYNIRKVQSIDVFGRVCTDTYSTVGTSTDCDYPPIDRREWTIEDYKKLIKK